MNKHLTISAETAAIPAFGSDEGVSDRASDGYLTLRHKIGRLRSSNYDISDRCNLDCEGCLFFAGQDYKAHADDRPLDIWDGFFRTEAERGVNFAYIAGAEPSLQPDRLQVIARHIRRGVIFTNGIKKVASDLPYRIHISLWGAGDDNRRTRGADNTAKALRNYAGDPRAVFVYTINAGNIDSIPDVVRRVREYGLRISFSYFSPTDDYLRDLPAQDTGDTGRLIMTQADFARAHDVIASCIDTWPETVCYSLHYDRWVRRNDLYTIGPDGLAVDCGGRNTRHHRHYGVDLKQSAGKCCSPNLSCRDCKAYAQAYATFLTRRPPTRDDPEFAAWMEVWRTWSDLFLMPDKDGDH